MPSRPSGSITWPPAMSDLPYESTPQKLERHIDIRVDVPHAADAQPKPVQILFRTA